MAASIPPLRQLALGGVDDFWGVWDLGHPRLRRVALDRPVLGPAHAIGKTFAMLPGAEEVRSADEAS